jgi:rubrerythrin
MALDTASLDQALTRELAATLDRPLLFRLGDEFLPPGTRPLAGSTLRCCTCGYTAKAGTKPTRCLLCGCRAWELQPEHVRTPA